METKWLLLQWNSAELSQLFHFVIYFYCIKKGKQSELVSWYVVISPSTFSFGVLNLRLRNGQDFLDLPRDQPQYVCLINGRKHLLSLCS